MPLLYLVDLTHVSIVVASNVMPLAIGLLGANVRKELPEWRVELCKYPADLDAMLSRERPDVIGFSCYSWNTYVGMRFAQRIKQRWPEIVVICGGPNYDAEDFWQQFGGFVDYFVHKEGELALVELLRRLGTGTEDQCPSVHTAAARNPLLPRIKDLDILPSPYVTGLMDKFFDGVLIPLLHTTRGCAFSCTFCQEGQAYYNKIARRYTLNDDLEYIGPRAGTLKDMYLSDANVGMLKDDSDKARAIAKCQQKYGWPQYIHCSGGKNHKERVLEFAEIVGGRMGVSASLQTTDPTVLANIKRENISVEQLVDVARRGSRIDANTYAEIILNLPGDTVAAHTNSLRDAVNSGVSYLRMYQLILLPETEMNTPETRAKFGLKTAWRIMPRCFGNYTFQGEDFVSAEVEEIVIAQDSMSFEDYIECRELALTIEICHNTGLFRDLRGLCEVSGVEWFSLLLGFHARRRSYLPELYDEFREHTVRPLFGSRAEALSFAQSHLDMYLTEQIGTNELFNAKAKAFFTLQEKLHECMYQEAELAFPAHAEYLQEARTFSLARKQGLLGDAGRTRHLFHYDFPALVELDFVADPHGHQRVVTIDFHHSPEQRDMIDQFVRQYGTSDTGLGRILLRAHLAKLFRQMEYDGVVSAAGFETAVRRASNLQD